MSVCLAHQPVKLTWQPLTTLLPADYVADDYYGEHMLDSFYGDAINEEPSTVASVENTLKFQPESSESVEEFEDTDDSEPAWKSKHSGGHAGGDKGRGS